MSAKSSLAWCGHVFRSNGRRAANQKNKTPPNERPWFRPWYDMDCSVSRQPACRSPIRRAVGKVCQPSQAVDSALRAARNTALFKALICAIISARMTRISWVSLFRKAPFFPARTKQRKYDGVAGSMGSCGQIHPQKSRVNFKRDIGTKRT
jgi:hypothetical protein